MTSPRTWGVPALLLAAACWAQPARADTTSAAAPREAPAAATAPSPMGAPPEAATLAPAAAAEGGAYTVRLRALERNVNDLKEQVFRTRARLNLLKETVLGGVIGASRCVIKHKNEMGASFRLIKAVYALDGVQIFNKADDTGRLSEMTEFDIYNGAIQPGSHTLTVQFIYQGYGFGVFSYLKGYKFKASSSHTFVAADNKATVVVVVGYEKGGIATNMEDKPAVEFRVNLVTPEAGGSPAAKK
ncbi:MAG: dihydrolipoamide acetyltransferase [Polyangia bacterium]